MSSLPFHRSHSLIVGINDYRNGVPSLQSAVKDALALANALQTSHGFSTPGADNIVLLDANATTHRVLTTITHDWVGRVQADDRVLVYFAGHGISMPSDEGPAGYLLLCDAVLDDQDTFMPMRELNDALLALPCRHLLVILDCCFAGTFRWAHVRDVMGTSAIVY